MPPSPCSFKRSGVWATFLFQTAVTDLVFRSARRAARRGRPTPSNKKLKYPAGFIQPVFFIARSVDARHAGCLAASILQYGRTPTRSPTGAARGVHCHHHPLGPGVRAPGGTPCPVAGSGHLGKSARTTTREHGRTGTLAALQLR